MGAKRWGDAAERVETEDGILVKTHQEYTITDDVDLAEIDTGLLMQGSIVYDISTGKMYLWSGEKWIDTEGNEWAGVTLYYYLVNSGSITEISPDDPITESVGNGIGMLCYDHEDPTDTDEPVRVTPTITEGEGVISVEVDEYDTVIVSTLSAGTAYLELSAFGTSATFEIVVS